MLAGFMPAQKNALVFCAGGVACYQHMLTFLFIYFCRLAHIMDEDC